MEERKHHNRIGGAWVDSTSGLTHEVPTPQGEPMGSWPRSGEDDLDAALEQALEASASWREMRHVQRVGLLHQGLESVVRAASIDQAIAQRVGLPVAECVRYRRQAFRRGDAVLTHAPEQKATRGVALVRVDARAAVSGLVEELFVPLMSGMPALLLSDPLMPFLADELCIALESAGIPRGVMGVLHDDGLTVFRAALARPEVTRVQLRGTDSLVREARQILESRPSTPGARDAGFGAGVPGMGGGALEANVLTDRTFVVRSGSDPDGAAEEVVRRAFGAIETWSGQAEGSVGRVLCHERVFSPFTDALLSTLEELCEEGSLLPPLDPGYWDDLSARVSLGLDEGATLIHGEPTGSRRPRRDAILTPSVFTNAEPRMRLARAGSPASVLVLLRCKDDAHAATLAEELDGERRATELAAPGGRLEHTRGDGGTDSRRND